MLLVYYYAHSLQKTAKEKEQNSTGKQKTTERKMRQSFQQEWICLAKIEKNESRIRLSTKMGHITAIYCIMLEYAGAALNTKDYRRILSDSMLFQKFD